ncbi:MAG: hypothetical protein OXC56_07550 [Chloroflexi bacterium]|nr:hypothetical protein [Chloroflexota bacterium]
MANDDDGDGQDAPGRLRSPLLADGQPNFHWWLFLPGVGVAVLWALYGAVTAEADATGRFLGQLLWPGIPIFVAATAAAWLGWRLDID